MIRKLYKASPDGHALGMILVAQAGGKNMDGIHELPSGRWVAIGGGKVSVPLSNKGIAMGSLMALQNKKGFDPSEN